MNTFANYFRCATNSGGNEVVIQFLQSYPTFDDQTAAVNGVGVDQITSIVMGRGTAYQLVQVLQQMLSDTARLNAENQSNSTVPESDTAE